MQKYNPGKIEKKWQKYWEAKKTFVAKDVSKKKKKYVLVEFPYPSGAGLHMGHVRPYVAADVYSRFMRLKGFETMYPMGWDAFGLPAENYAIKHGIHPSKTTAKNIANAKRQVQAWGISFDWSREVNTTDPAYYKWTQWLFLQFFKKGLAYEATGPINWCPKDKTGLANEEVIDGKCERCGTAVEKRELRQWFLKITAYAQKLLDGLKDLEWPEQVKLQQENWIGKSMGAEIEFRIKNQESRIKIFTTRPDTLFGVTYVVVAPEHELIKNQESGIKNQEELQRYVESVKDKSEIERTAVGDEKTGVELKGVKAVNPANGEEVSVWCSDYVLGHYGTGAVMAVPAHDERDFAFAKKYNLPIRVVVKSDVDFADAPYTGDGLLIESGKFSGQNSEEALPKMAAEFGALKTQYKLRDWLFSRQRYWGEPIPVIHCPDCGIVPVPEKDLPVLLPSVKKYEPTGTGESPLAAIEKWVNVKCPTCKGKAKRETNTMPQWAGSSWYFLRYTDPKNKKAFADKQKLKRWMPVDVYFGGMEHTTLHLLYSRFWNLFLADQKLVPVKEPYAKRIPHGIILASDGEKMSKSRGNVVNPDDIAKQYGADSMRMYELFLGPHEMAVSWNDQGIIGVRRFLEKVWTWIMDHGSWNNKDQKSKIKNQNDRSKLNNDSEKVGRALHKLIKKVGEDVDGFRFNTAISSFMEFMNLVKDEPVSFDSVKTFLVLLYPFAPHIAEELYEMLGGRKSLQFEAWPKFNPKKLIDTEVTVIVQVNGKLRDSLVVPADSLAQDVQQLALASEKVKNFLGGAEIKRVIFVPGKLINFVI